LHYWPADEPLLPAGGVAGEPVPAGGVAGVIGADPEGAERVAPGPPWSGAVSGRCSKSQAARAKAQSDAATSFVFMIDSSFVVELPLSKRGAQLLCVPRCGASRCTLSRVLQVRFKRCHVNAALRTETNL
jgi:hypothetical protein